MDQQIRWGFLWVGLRWFKHRVITEIPPAEVVIPPICWLYMTSLRVKCDDKTSRLPPFCRVATPSVNSWRSPRRPSPKRRGVALLWSWRPRQVCECCPRKKPALCWRRWGACSLCPQFGTNTTRPAMRQHEETAEKPLLTCVAKKRRWVCPSGGYDCGSCGLCGVTIFVIENIKSMLLFLSYIWLNICHHRSDSALSF